MDRLPRGLNDGLAVYTQEETRLVRSTATLFDFRAVEGSGRLLLPPTVDFERLVVPVYEGREKVGAASLFFQGGKVMALMAFDYATPERLDLTLGRDVYAIPRGAYYLDTNHPKWYIVDFVAIEGVDLSMTPDERQGVGSTITVTRYDSMEE